jgi:hypothetical protein
MLSSNINQGYGRIDIGVTFRAVGLPRTRRRAIGSRRRVWHPSVTYGFVRSRQLDGTLFEGPRIGSYVLTAARVCAGWGTVSAKRWPRRKGDPWPPPEPPGLDDVARHNRWLGYFRARDLDEICPCLKQGLPVQIALPIHKGWRHPVNDYFCAINIKWLAQFQPGRLPLSQRRRNKTGRQWARIRAGKQIRHDFRQSAYQNVRRG